MNVTSQADALVKAFMFHNEKWGIVHLKKKKLLKTRIEVISPTSNS
jgi:hypothetical protein